METDPATPLAAPVLPTARNILSLAHQTYASRWGLIVGASVTALVLSWVIGFVAGLLDLAIVGSDALITPVSALAQILVITPLAIGPIYIAVRLFRGEPAEFGDLTVGFRRWGAIVAITFLTYALMYLVLVPFGVAIGALAGFGSAGPAMIALTVLLGFGMLGVMLWVGVRLYFATLLCADPAGPRLGVIESFKTSWSITRGHAWALFVVAVALVLISAVAALLLVVPFLLYAGPLIMCAAAVAYALVCHEAGLIPLAPYDDCPHCKYDLRATESPTCPECGQTVPRGLAVN